MLGGMKHPLIVAAIIVTASASSTGRAAGQIPERYTNLQILSKDIQRPALVAVMRSFAMELGVRCEHCHLGEGNDLSQFDFASDTRPAKATARKMLKMIETINRDALKDVGDPARLPKVTCYTCHRGSKLPLTAPPSGGGIAHRP
jgi:hypothetical protein